jgi:hypothetical protein
VCCPARDDECSAATRGWKLRADAYFEAQRTSGLRDDARPFDAPHNTDPASVSQECATRDLECSPAQRYERWRSCLETARPQQFGLPLGDFKAPTTGCAQEKFPAASTFISSKDRKRMRLPARRSANTIVISTGLQRSGEPCPCVYLQHDERAAIERAACGKYC